MTPLVVIGDTLLDVDIEGSADRLCPEAPVPVVDVERRWERPGGAGLAALLAARSTGQVVLVTALGTDTDADRLTNLLGSGVEVVAVPLVGTTVCKTRVRAGGQSLVRLDSGGGIATTQPLGVQVREAITGAGAILVSDYGRGMANHPEIRALVAERAAHVPVVWDPHPRGSAPVPGARLITPNDAEATRAEPEARGPLDRAAGLTVRWDSDAVAVTVGAAGAALATRSSGTSGMIAVPESARLAAASRPDTCGAGDRFASAAATALLDGASVEQAVTAAVESAARFVGLGGASAVSVCSSTQAPALGGGDAHTDPYEFAVRVRRNGGRLVATGGCFDLLHRGHVSLLQQARMLGDALIVCLNSDDSVRRMKGADRPLVRAEDRARVLSELGSVDSVVIFDESSPAEILERLRPDVWVKGDDYADKEIPEAEVVRRHGGDVVFVRVVDGYSTTRMLATARAATRADPRDGRNYPGPR
ncbi:D-beta-D-heptose 1-phosphate adenosyltransferase [Rhodococcus oxybenzonivorans]|uniref:D-beta-D-heptose 1-phosphate adenosyltransferase n=1 Tax=Rhodococcus oxybenzonivorans TaxID=1990687 RepID=A0A2S2BVE9_9NOCA|nr:PfkB family carbohydrate kinase [Rhodococcus oxybenzonivorans]AWK72620.1 D-beta-D-heptose 1-phosphate adenosyltransferase [Rhodococcus oxybenzonivorans]